MGGVMSRKPVTTVIAPIEAPPGCWWYQRGFLSPGMDCNCHKTQPRRCNPGPPPFPESMAEWMGMPPPPHRQLRPEELKWQEFFSSVPNPYPMLDEAMLKPREVPKYRAGQKVPENYTDIRISFEAASPGKTLANQGESTDPTPYSHWGPVPFNGLAPPVQALMPDEIGQQNFVRTTHYNRQLEALLFSGKDVHHAVWHSNKHMPFKPQLTIYRLWSDNYTYAADWDPRVVLNLLSGSIVHQISTPQQMDRLGTIFQLMPARHTYAVQHCAMRTAELVAEHVQQALAELGGSWRGQQRAHHMSPWMVYLFEMYQLWKDITGLDIHRSNTSSHHTKREHEFSDARFAQNTNNRDRPKRSPKRGAAKWNEWSDKYKKPGNGPTWRVFAIPWYKSPYNPKANAAKYQAQPEYQPWERPVPEIHTTDVPWNSICEDVHAAAKRWRSIKTNDDEFRPHFREILQAWKILGPKLRKLGHGARLDRMERCLTWRDEGTPPNWMVVKADKMCDLVKPHELCLATGHAMYMLMVAIRQQIEPVYWDL